MKRKALVFAFVGVLLLGVIVCGACSAGKGSAEPEAAVSPSPSEQTTPPEQTGAQDTAIEQPQLGKDALNIPIPRIGFISLEGDNFDPDKSVDDEDLPEKLKPFSVFSVEFLSTDEIVLRLFESGADEPFLTANGHITANKNGVWTYRIVSDTYGTFSVDISEFSNTLDERVDYPGLGFVLQFDLNDAALHKYIFGATTND